MFTGSINKETKSVILDIASKWDRPDLYVGCSGNFTVERLLKDQVSKLHGNDVTLYSCCLGRHLAGKKMKIGVKLEGFEWLEPYLETSLDSVATLLLSTRILEPFFKGTPFHQRMAAAYLERFPDLHARTKEKIKTATEGLKLSSFFAGDVLNFVKEIQRRDYQNWCLRSCSRKRSRGSSSSSSIRESGR